MANTTAGDVLQAAAGAAAVQGHRLFEQKQEIDRLRHLLHLAIDEHDSENGESNNLEHWSFKAHVALAPKAGE